MVLQRFTRWFHRLPVANPIERQQAEVFQWFLLLWIFIAVVGILLLSRVTSRPTNPADVLAPTAFRVLQVAGGLLWVTPVVAWILLRRAAVPAAVTTASVGI